MHTLSLVTFLLAFGLSLRLTRLAVDDAITAPLRLAFAKRQYADGKLDAATQLPAPHPAWKFLYELFDCPWCMGVWTSAASFGWAYAYGESAAFVWVAGAASASWLVGLGSVLVYRFSGED